MPRKRNIRIVVEYDGTGYSGWQVQKDRPTVQAELQKAVCAVSRSKRALVVGSGRTDAGVHAEGQVANFHTASPIPARKWPEAMNAHLPEDIAVLSAADVPLEFHAQFDAKEKCYRYRVLNRGARPALDRHRAHLVRADLDVGAMREGAALLVGTHDFRSFGSEMSRKEKTVRTVRSFEIASAPPVVDFLVWGDGFLYNQVRSMVGTLLQVGVGKRPPSWIGEVLKARDRKRAGANVPARGLTLVQVRY